MGNWVTVLCMLNTLLQKNWPWLVAAGLIVFWLLATTIKFDAPIAESRPVGGADEILQLAQREDLNVLFVLIDTLRADRLGSYGYERDTSPAIDKLASRGVRFGRHLSQSTWTKSSMASMWTSLYPNRTGVTRFDHIVSEAAIMPAERLRDAGYRTVGLYRNGWVAPTFGFDQGFDVYTRPAQRTMNPTVHAENPTVHDASTDEDAISAAIEFLRVSGHDQKWFLYLHLMDIHEYLYDKNSALFGGTHSDMYDNSIRWTDGTLNILFAYLEEFGLAEKTLVVVTADHGEAFRERGLEGHAREVYRETTEIPLFMSFPFQLAKGLVIPTRTQGTDVWPTIFELIGLEQPEDIDGTSRVPEILAAARSEAASTTETIAVSFLDETWGQQAAISSKFRIGVSEGPFRYLRATAGGNRTEASEELFDAATDPAELKNVASQHPELVERLRAVAEAQLELKPTWGEAPKREIGELELNQLRALGYAIP